MSLLATVVKNRTSMYRSSIPHSTIGKCYCLHTLACVKQVAGLDGLHWSQQHSASVLGHVTFHGPPSPGRGEACKVRILLHIKLQSHSAIFTGTGSPGSQSKLPPIHLLLEMWRIEPETFGIPSMCPTTKPFPWVAMITCPMGRNM